MSTLDHLVWAVPSLDEAARRLLHGHGLRAVPGGSHPAWGTRNAVVPLGDSYLELVEVADPEAPRVGFTRRVAEVADLGGGPALWSERVDDIHAHAHALGYDVVAGTRVNDDGSTLSWRVAGMPQACTDPAVPFLIQWDDPTCMPGRLAADHRCGTVMHARVLIGPNGPRGLVITTEAGELRLAPD